MDEYDKLIIEFFKLFSRFEYALKITGFHYGDGNAKANWVKFSASIDEQFNKKDSQALQESVAYLLSNPPNKQVVENGELGWSDNPPDAANETELILNYICRVRNNLFHGGKYRGRVLANPEHSRDLIESSITILKYARNLSVEVNQAIAT